VQPQHFARTTILIVPSHKPTKLRGVRLRALVFLLVLTAVDYLLWNWSIANGRDVLSLGAGLTLLPLAALSVAQLALAGARLLGLALGNTSARSRARAQPVVSRGTQPTDQTAQASASKSDPPSSRLAA
jgi:hypothetical protein